MTSELTCCVCGRQMGQKKPRWLFICECGVLGSNLEPKIPSEIGASIIDEGGRESGLSNVREHNNKLIIAEIRKHIKKGGRLLDVGSGLGFFLKAGSEAGFDCLGIEPDANAVRRTQEQNVRHGYFPSALMSDEKFDAIVFNDVLEHIPDAFSAVLAAQNHLSKGGILVLNCPDRRGVIYRVSTLLTYLGIYGPFERMWQKNTPSPHRWYFRRQELFDIGARVSLQPIGTVKLKTISRHGLFDRIFYIRGQPKVMSWLSLFLAYLVLPFISILPSDLGVAIMRRKSDP